MKHIYSAVNYTSYATPRIALAPQCVVLRVDAETARQILRHKLTEQVHAHVPLYGGTLLDLPLWVVEDNNHDEELAHHLDTLDSPKVIVRDREDPETIEAPGFLDGKLRTSLDGIRFEGIGRIGYKELLCERAFACTGELIPWSVFEEVAKP